MSAATAIVDDDIDEQDTTWTDIEKTAIEDFTGSLESCETAVSSCLTANTLPTAIEAIHVRKEITTDMSSMSPSVYSEAEDAENEDEYVDIATTCEMDVTGRTEEQATSSQRSHKLTESTAIHEKTVGKSVSEQSTLPAPPFISTTNDASTCETGPSKLMGQKSTTVSEKNVGKTASEQSTLPAPPFISTTNDASTCETGPSKLIEAQKSTAVSEKTIGKSASEQSTLSATPSISTMNDASTCMTGPSKLMEAQKSTTISGKTAGKSASEQSTLRAPPSISTMNDASTCKTGPSKVIEAQIIMPPLPLKVTRSTSTNNASVAKPVNAGVTKPINAQVNIKRNIPQSTSKVTKTNDVERGAPEPRLTAGMSSTSDASDMLVAVGLLFGTMVIYLLLFINDKVKAKLWIQLVFLIAMVAVCIVGYLAVKQDGKPLFIITVVLTIVALVGAIYFAAKAIVDVTEHMANVTAALFIVSAIEVTVLIHIIYYSIKLM